MKRALAAFTAIFAAVTMLAAGIGGLLISTENVSALGNTEHTATADSARFHGASYDIFDAKNTANSISHDPGYMLWGTWNDYFAFDTALFYFDLRAYEGQVITEAKIRFHVNSYTHADDALIFGWVKDPQLYQPPVANSYMNLAKTSNSVYAGGNYLGDLAIGWNEFPLTESALSYINANSAYLIPLKLMLSWDNPVEGTVSDHQAESQFAPMIIVNGMDVPASSQFTINMLAGDTFSYQASTSVPSTYSISAGTLSTVGLTHSAGKISGTAALGKETVTLRATSNDGGPTRYAYQDITFNVYRMLTLTGSVPAASWAGAAYSTTLTVADVDPDATGEVTLSLNAAATTAGYTISKVSETSWKLERTAVKNVAGSVLVEVTAASSAGGIGQSKKISTTIATYADVAITSTPTGHKGSGTNVWLVEGDDTYTYTVTGTPEGVTFSATGLAGGMTFSSGKLTVPCSAPIAETTVTITASSSAGGSTHTATQTLKVRVWDKNVFTSEPSVSNIVTTIDGRTITASVVADNYTSIVWDMGDGTTYEGVTSVQHTYKDAGNYVIRVTVSNDKGEEASSVTAVSFGTQDPGAQDPGDDDKDDPKDNITAGITDFAKKYAWLIVAGVGAIVLVAYAVARHPVVLIVGIGLLVIAALLKYGVI